MKRRVKLCLIVAVAVCAGPAAWAGDSCQPTCSTSCGAQPAAARCCIPRCAPGSRHRCCALPPANTPVVASMPVATMAMVLAQPVQLAAATQYVAPAQTLALGSQGSSQGSSASSTCAQLGEILQMLKSAGAAGGGSGGNSSAAAQALDPATGAADQVRQLDQRLNSVAAEVNTLSEKVDRLIGVLDRKAQSDAARLSRLEDKLFPGGGPGKPIPTPLPDPPAR